MKRFRLLCALTTLTLACKLTAETIPAADFARSPELSNAKLSPDGQYMGYIFIHDGWPQLSFLNLATNKAIRGARGANRWLTTTDFEWITDKRVLSFTAGQGLTAVNRDGREYQGFESLQRGRMGEGLNEMVYASGRDPSRVLMNTYGANGWKRVPFPDVVAVNTITGTAKVEVKNPGNVRAWAADWSGHVRFGLVQEGLHAKLLHRDAPGRPWDELADLGGNGTPFSLVGLDATGRTLYVSRPDAKGYWALHPFDLDARRFGEPLLQGERVDVLSDHSRSGFAGVPLTAPFFSAERHTLLGVNYVAEAPRQRWFDPVMAAVQKQIDALNPGLLNFVVSTDRTGTQCLILSWSDRNPGFYSLLDLTKQKLRPLGQRMPWIKPEQMAAMIPIQCRARDGLLLPGYITLPPGQDQKNLPLVALVHGGPWQRDVWGFDPIVQFLASRGYAVLQVNYRGSTGYGQDMFEQGKKEIGGAIQNDIVDAVKWAIARGIADPGRVAIMGASFGGYSALFGVARDPELFRCAVAVAAVSDWPKLLERRVEDSDDEKLAQIHWIDLVGDWHDSQDQKRLAAISPVNLAQDIKAPVFLVHGKEDRVVPYSQAKAMLAALRAVGRAPETQIVSNMGHSWPADEEGTEFLERLEKFLATNLAKSGASQAAPKP